MASAIIGTVASVPVEATTSNIPPSSSPPTYAKRSRWPFPPRNGKASRSSLSPPRPPWLSPLPFLFLTSPRGNVMWRLPARHSSTPCAILRRWASPAGRRSFCWWKPTGTARCREISWKRPASPTPGAALREASQPVRCTTGTRHMKTGAFSGWFPPIRRKIQVFRSGSRYSG